MTRYMDPVPQSGRFARGLPILTAWGLISWLAGCSVIVDANRPQCSTDADCANRGAEFAGSVCHRARAKEVLGLPGAPGGSWGSNDPLSPEPTLGVRVRTAGHLRRLQVDDAFHRRHRLDEGAARHQRTALPKARRGVRKSRRRNGDLG